MDCARGSAQGGEGIQEGKPLTPRILRASSRVAISRLTPVASCTAFSTSSPFLLVRSPWPRPSMMMQMVSASRSIMRDRFSCNYGQGRIDFGYPTVYRDLQ